MHQNWPPSKSKEIRSKSPEKLPNPSPPFQIFPNQKKNPNHPKTLQILPNLRRIFPNTTKIFQIQRKRPKSQEYLANPCKSKGIRPKPFKFLKNSGRITRIPKNTSKSSKILQILIFSQIRQIYGQNLTPAPANFSTAFYKFGTSREPVGNQSGTSREPVGKIRAPL